MTEEFDREQRVFREALAREAESEQFEPLASADVAKRRTFGWPRAVAAVLVIGVVGALGFSALPYLQGGMPGAASAASAAPSEGAPAPNPDLPGGPGEPAAGWRWESFRDVVVQVPADWGYDRAPTSAWCISEEWPTAPFVDTGHGMGPVAAILCEGVMPADKLVPYLVMQPTEIAVVESLPDGWSAHTATVGEVSVSVVTDAAGADLAEQFLATARQVPADHNGCPTAGVPETVEVDLAGLTGFPIVLCSYDTDEAAWPGLRSSTKLEGEAATRAWDAIFAAPAGGGPDGSEAECGGLPADPATVLLVEGAVIGLQVSGCTGNGLADEGVTGGLREVTEELCRALLVPPVSLDSGFGPAATRCMAAVAER